MHFVGHRLEWSSGAEELRKVRANMQICESKLIQKAEIRPTGCFIPSVTFQTQVISGGAYPQILLLIRQHNAWRSRGRYTCIQQN